jgi:spore coat protein U-like protein
LDAGVGAGATVDTRYLTGPSASAAAYSLYRDASRSSVWGNAQGINTVSGQGTGQAQSYTVYGRLAGMQAGPVPGPYADTVTVFVYY